MIKLDPKAVEKFEEIYLAKMQGKVEVKIEAAISRSAVSSDIKKMFYDSYGARDEEFIKCLLIGQLNDIKKYQKINNLFEMRRFISDGKNIISDDMGMNIDYKRFVSKFNSDDLMKEKSKFLWNNNDLEEFKSFLSKVEERYEEFCECFKEVIYYRLLPPEFRHEVILAFGVDVCPYCNRQYISAYKRKRKLTTADLDHFYPKRFYPYFSLSLYNFIPACQICNSRFKLDKDLEILYPLVDEFGDDATFCVETNDSAALLGFNENFEVEIKITDGPKKRKIENNIEMFGLDSLYKNHKKEAQRALLVKNAYGDAYKKSFEDLFKKMGLKDSQVNILVYGFSNKVADFSSKPLSKFTYDIVNGD